jgi:hypothetical protein
MAKRYSCGTIVPSQCVPYTGKDLSFLTTDQQPDCDANIDDVFDLISTAILNIQTAINLTNLNNQCLTGVPTDVDVKGMFQIEIDKICGIDAALTALTTIVNAWNISTQLVNIDLQCLSAAAAPCQVGTNTYTLISILNLFRSEICTIKTFLGI